MHTKYKTFFIFLVTLISNSMFSQGFEPWQILFKDNVLNVEVSFKTENSSCLNLKKHKIQYKVVGKLNSFEDYLIWTTDYIDCSGKTIFQQHCLNISLMNPLSNGDANAVGDTWPSQEDEFLAESIITKFYDVHTSKTPSRNSGIKTNLVKPNLLILKSNEMIELLVKEAYIRMQEDIHASHILVKISETALPKDTLEAYTRILKYRNRIIKGEDFNKVAAEKGVSDDPSAKDNFGDLGFFTCLQMVYPFESAAYNTKIGKVSMPFRTRYGYHIIKVTERRKTQGEVMVAHIMVKTNLSMTKEDSLNSFTKITEIHTKLKAGSKFEDLAREYSDDKSSARKGGELPWFGTGKMPLEFEKAAFSIAKKGDFCTPIITKYGWHIVKLIDQRELATFEELKTGLTEKIKNDSRSKISQPQ